MKMQLMSLTLALVTFSGIIPPLYAGKLNTIKQDLQSSETKEAPQPRSERTVIVHRNTLDEEDSIDNVFGQILFYGILYGTYYVLIGPDDEESEVHQETVNKDETNFFSGLRGKQNAIRSSNYLSLFRDDSQLEGLHFSTEFSPAPRWGLRADYHKLQETTDSGSDEMDIVRASLILNRIRTQKLSFQWIFGATWIDGVGGLHGGARLKYYVFQPFSLQAQYLASSHDITFKDWELMLGLHWHRFETRLGYQHLKFGQTNLEGPVIGIAVHL